jgi:hypothetical protein
VKCRVEPLLFCEAVVPRALARRYRRPDGAAIQCPHKRFAANVPLVDDRGCEPAQMARWMDGGLACLSKVRSLFQSRERQAALGPGSTVRRADSHFDAAPPTWGLDFPGDGCLAARLF